MADCDIFNCKMSKNASAGLGPIFFENITPEVFKTTLREIADLRPCETLDQTHILGAILLNKVQFFKHKPKKIIR